MIINLLGDVWKPVTNWQALLNHPSIKLHFHAKSEARPVRKMGHYNCLVKTLESSMKLANDTRLASGVSATGS
jgi:5-(carboxyamino)imidazole ribonucleotide synthase